MRQVLTIRDDDAGFLYSARHIYAPIGEHGGTKAPAALAEAAKAQKSHASAASTASTPPAGGAVDRQMSGGALSASTSTTASMVRRRCSGGPPTPSVTRSLSGSFGGGSMPNPGAERGGPPRPPGASVPRPSTAVPVQVAPSQGPRRGSRATFPAPSKGASSRPQSPEPETRHGAATPVQVAVSLGPGRGSRATLPAPAGPAGSVPGSPEPETRRHVQRFWSGLPPAIPPSPGPMPARATLPPRSPQLQRQQSLPGNGPSSHGWGIVRSPSQDWFTPPLSPQRAPRESSLPPSPATDPDFLRRSLQLQGGSAGSGARPPSETPGLGIGPGLTATQPPGPHGNAGACRSPTSSAAPWWVAGAEDHVLAAGSRASPMRGFVVPSAPSPLQPPWTCSRLRDVRDVRDVRVATPASPSRPRSPCQAGSPPGREAYPRSPLQTGAAYPQSPPNVQPSWAHRGVWQEAPMGTSSMTSCHEPPPPPPPPPPHMSYGSRPEPGCSPYRSQSMRPAPSGAGGPLPETRPSLVHMEERALLRVPSTSSIDAGVDFTSQCSPARRPLRPGQDEGPYPESFDYSEPLWLNAPFGPQHQVAA